MGDKELSLGFSTVDIVISTVDIVTSKGCILLPKIPKKYWLEIDGKCAAITEDVNVAKMWVWQVELYVHDFHMKMIMRALAKKRRK